MASPEPSLPAASIGARARPSNMLIKGTALRSTIAAIELVAGPVGLARVISTLRADVRGLVETGLLASKGYPPSVSAALHIAVRDALGAGTWAMNHKVGLMAARVDYGGVYRAVLWTLDEGALLDRLPRSWRQYNSAGGVTIERGPGRALASIEGVHDFNLGMWTAIAGRVEGLFSMVGSKEARARVTNPGDTRCQIDVRWKP